MKKRKTLSKILASCASIAVLVGSLSMNVFAAESQYVGYDVQSNGFNVYGIGSNGNQIQTTFSNRGYNTYISVNGNDKQKIGGNSSFAYDTAFTTGSVATTISADIDSTGKAVLITYSVTNNGSDAAGIRLGSCADCKIGNNDNAPVRANGNGLSMTDGTNYFYLIPGNGNFTTTWSGKYSDAATNIFTNADSHNYSGDSGLAWSWSFTVPAGRTVTKAVILAAGAELTTHTISFNANGGSGNMESTQFISGISASIPGNTFTKEGYGFVGWSTSADSTEVAYEDQGEISLSGDIELYAVWLPLPTIIEDTEPATDLVYTGEPIELAVPGQTDDGTFVYSFYPDGPFTEEIPTGTSSGTYTIYYRVNGDDEHSNTPVESFDVTIEGTTVTATIDGTEYDVNPEETLDRPEDPTRPGYEFGGWYSDPEFEDEYDFSSPVGIDGVTLYPMWIPLYATADEEPEPRTLTYTGAPLELAVPGSTEEGTMVYALSPDGPFTETVPTATASGTYTVYYKILGDEDHADSEVSSFTVTVASVPVTVTVNGVETEANAETILARPADPTREGYDFGGWYTDADCQNEYTFGSPVGVNGVTLYPKWTAFEYQLTGGGSGEWTEGSTDGLAFRAERTNNGAATFSHFTGVKVDRNTLDEANYSAESGSVIVTLKPDYLKTLAAGEHTLEIMFDDGASVTTTFTIKAASSTVSTGEALTSTTTVIGSIMVIAAAALVTVTLTKRIREERK